MSIGGIEPRRAIIFTAIPVEYQAVRDHLTQLREEAQSGSIYERGNFAANSQSWDVVIMEIGGGNVRVALETERAINFFNPSVILLVGVAGGLKDVKIGDVVVATKVYAYESGRAGETFQSRPEVSNPTYRLVQLARTESRKKDWLRRLKEPTIDPIPRVFVAPIASGGSVITSTESTLYELLRSNYSDAVAVDMEGFGFFNAIRNHPEVEALSIRGISDLIDNKKQADAANQQEIAAKHASAFAYEMLAKLVVTKSKQGIEPASLPGNAQPEQPVSSPSLGVVIKQGLDPKNIESNATNDKPTESIKEDKLGFEFYVEALKNFITSQDTTTPLTISINGLWGTGKSSLMRMLKNELDPFEKVPWHFLWKELTWYMRYFSTSPSLWFGKLLLRFGDNRWSKYIREGLIYRPGNPGTQPTQQLPRHQQYWAKIITKRQPMSPPFHPTVWFNAWKFSQEEQIWAALATEVLNQLDKKYPWPLRFIFKFRLVRERFTPWRTVGHVALNLLPAVLIGLSYILYNAYLLPYVVPFLTVHLFPLFQTLLSWFPHANPQTAAAKTANSAGVVVWTIAATTALVTKFKHDKINPFKIPLKDLFDPPKYEEKIGFIGQFEEDFEHIVNVITQHFSKAWEPRKLVIFIDDLDRCRPPQVVSIIEAISLFLDSKQCVFVIGMDPAAVVTSIEDKYKDLVAKMRKETPSIVAPGSLFLDKIIQIPFKIPRPTPDDINFLVEEIIYSKDKQLSTPSLAPSPPSINPQSPPVQQDGNVRDAASASVDVGSFERVDVQNAIKTASSYLKGNPRMVKRFINLFRLKVYLADKLTMLRGQSLTPLAILVAWSMRWPEVTKLLLDEAHNSDVCTYLAGICNCIEEDGSWKVSTSAQGDQLVTTFEYDQVLSDLENRRKQEENFPAHWCQLPWEEWVCDKDFRCCLKYMEKEKLWQQLKAREDTQVDSTLDLAQLMRL